jgi:hypothetical protein
MTKQGNVTSTAIAFDPNRWPFIFTLLSMDVVVAFYPLIGLEISEPTRFRDLVRSQILQVRREFAAVPPEGASYSPKKTLDAIERTFGTAQGKHLVWWGQRIFAWDLQEHRELTLWEDVLRFCADDAGRWNQLGLPAHLSNAARQEFVRAIDREAYDQHYVEYYDKPLSDWDLHMYAVNLFDDDDVATPSPAKYLYPTFMNNRNYRFWAWLMKQTTSRERDSLMNNAITLAKQVASLSHAVQLPHPSRLEVGP